MGECRGATSKAPFKKGWGGKLSIPKDHDTRHPPFELRTPCVAHLAAQVWQSSPFIHSPVQAYIPHTLTEPHYTPGWRLDTQRREGWPRTPQEGQIPNW
jgi:hypothetical protein